MSKSTSTPKSTSSMWTKEQCTNYAKQHCIEDTYNKSFCQKYGTMDKCINENMPLRCRRQMGMQHPYLEQVCAKTDEVRQRLETESAIKCIDDTRIINKPLNMHDWNCIRNHSNTLPDLIKCAKET
jgi:hypothetical protein